LSAFDQSDFEQRLSLNEAVERCDALANSKINVMHTFWREYNDFMILHLSQRDSAVLSDGYAYIGAMLEAHVMAGLRSGLHDTGDLSQVNNARLMHQGYAQYGIAYAHRVGILDQELGAESDNDVKDQ